MAFFYLFTSARMALSTKSFLLFYKLCKPGKPTHTPCNVNKPTLLDPPFESALIQYIHYTRLWKITSSHITFCPWYVTTLMVNFYEDNMMKFLLRLSSYFYINILYNTYLLCESKCKNFHCILGKWFLKGFITSLCTLTVSYSNLNPKPCGYINLRCRAAWSHIWLLRRPIGEREALRHALAAVSSSGPTLRKS